MSIRLTDVHASTTVRGVKVPVLKGTSLEVPDGARIAVLGAPKSGKTTLMRVVCGTLAVDQGVVKRTSTTSWPIPLATFFSATSPVVRNIRFLMRLYGVTDEDFPHRVVEMGGIAEFLNEPLGKCPRFVKSRLAFGLGLGFEFDTYLFDGSLSPVDKGFKTRAAEVVAGRMAGRGYLLASANPKEVEENFDSVYVLEAGQARYFEAAKDGVEYFNQLLAALKQKDAVDKEAKQAEEPGEEIEGPGDIDVLASAIADEVE